MKFIKKYANAFTQIRMRDYFTLIPLLMLVPSIYFYFVDMFKPEYYYNSKMEMVDVKNSILLILLLIPAVHFQLLIRFAFYPHAKRWIEHSTFFQKVFGSSSFFRQFSYVNQKRRNIDLHTPDDLELKNVVYRGADSRVYEGQTVGTARGGRRNTAESRKSNSLILFIFKDCILRLFFYLIVLMISPILFILSVHFPTYELNNTNTNTF